MWAAKRTFSFSEGNRGNVRWPEGRGMFNMESSWDSRALRRKDFLASFARRRVGIAREWTDFNSRSFASPRAACNWSMVFFIAEKHFLIGLKHCPLLGRQLFKLNVRTSVIAVGSFDNPFAVYGNAIFAEHNFVFLFHGFAATVVNALKHPYVRYETTIYLLRPKGRDDL